MSAMVEGPSMQKLKDLESLLRYICPTINNCTTVPYFLSNEFYGNEPNSRSRYTFVSFLKKKCKKNQNEIKITSNTFAHISKDASSYLRNTCSPMFIAAVLTIARNWRHSRCFLSDEWIKKNVAHSHNGVLCDREYHQREPLKIDHERFFYPLVKLFYYPNFVYILLVI